MALKVMFVAALAALVVSAPCALAQPSLAAAGAKRWEELALVALLKNKVPYINYVVDIVYS
jgi:hypothetical protein